jgi:hypothetical protein
MGSGGKGGAAALFLRDIVAVEKYEQEVERDYHRRVSVFRRANVKLSCGHIIRGVPQYRVPPSKKRMDCRRCAELCSSRVISVRREHKKTKHGHRYLYAVVQLVDSKTIRRRFKSDAELDAWLLNVEQWGGTGKRLSTAPPASEMGLWEHRAPKKDQCCICGRPVTPAESVPEDRPTGWTGTEPKVQTWYYCRPCWDRHLEICGTDTREEVASWLRRPSRPWSRSTLRSARSRP